MTTHSSSDARSRSVRADLILSAETGAPPLGHLVGLHRVGDEDAYGLSLDPDRSAMAGKPGVLEVAMLADLALGGAIRDRAGAALPMPTIAMTIQLAPGRAQDVLWSDAECATEHFSRTAMSRCRLRTASGEVVGDAQGVFALPSLPYDGPGRAMPWDTRIGRESASEEIARDLTLAETEILEQVMAHAADTPSRSWGTTHVERQTTKLGDECALIPTAVMANRLGNVQGGALFTASVLAAARQGRFPVDAFVTGTIEFIAAVDVEHLVALPVTVLRSTRSSLFARVTLIQGDRTCAHVSVVFRS